MANNIQIFALLFLMLGSFKIIIPFASISRNATREFARKLAFATHISSIALLLAAVLGENILKRYGFPIPILALPGGIILFPTHC